MMLLLIEVLLILTNFTLVAIVYKGQRTLVTRLRLLEISFISFASSISIWIIIQSLYDYILKPEQAPVMQRLIDFGLLTSLLIVISFWVFMSQFANQKIKSSKLALHIFSSLLVGCLGIIFRPVYTVIEKGELTFAYKPLIYGIFTLYLLAYFVAGLRYIIIKKYWHKSQILQKSRKRIITGFVLSIALIVFGNVVLPVLYDQTSQNLLDALGQIFFALGATLISFSAAFSVFNLGVFNLRKFLFRTILGGFAYSIPAVVSVVLLTNILGDSVNLFDANTNSTARLLILSAYVIFSSVLILNIKSYVEKILTKLYDSKEFNEVVFAQKVERLIKTDISEELLDKYCKLLKNQLSVDRMAVYVAGKKGSDLEEFHSIADTQDNKIEQAVLVTELEKIRKVNEYVIMGFTGVDLKEGFIKTFDYVLQYEQNEIEGAVLLGAKTDGKRFYIDELSAVRKSFLEIELAMQNVFRINKLVAFNQSLEEKIEIATKQLRKTNEKLKALDEAKDEFISMASHQLRTPLTSIKGYISLILDGDMGKVPTKQRKMLNEAFSSSQRMVYLISDLLNVSRLKTGKFLIEPVDVYLPDVVEEEIDQVKEMAEVKNIKIHYSKPKIFTNIELDDMKIRQVIMNFIDNAIHYTPEGGDINVELTQTDKSVEFRVIDSGIGVPKAEQHHLFNKFYRAGNARKARPDGTGLGLFMGKKVIVASGGSIIFSSEEGNGSTFGFIFPKAKT